jgi:hypothetical protein
MTRTKGTSLAIPSASPISMRIQTTLHTCPHLRQDSSEHLDLFCWSWLRSFAGAALGNLVYSPPKIHFRCTQGLRVWTPYPSVLRFGGTILPHTAIQELCWPMTVPLNESQQKVGSGSKICRACPQNCLSCILSSKRLHYLIPHTQHLSSRNSSPNGQVLAPESRPQPDCCKMQSFFLAALLILSKKC